jgi:hypothetical protein
MANRNRRESPPPSRWGRSKRGTYFYVIHTVKRDHKGRKLYRLRYLYPPPEITSPKLWTLDELEETDMRWLKNKPKLKS